MEKVPDTPEGIILESPLEGMNQYFSDEFCRNMKKNRLRSDQTEHNRALSSQKAARKEYNTSWLLYGLLRLLLKIYMAPFMKEICRYSL